MLRALVDETLAPAVTAAACTVAASSPEAAAVRKRIDEVEGWVSSKLELAALLSRLDATASTEVADLRKSLKAMDKAAAAAVEPEGYEPFGPEGLP